MTRTPLLVLVALTAPGLLAPAASGPAPSFRYERSVVVDAPGAHSLPVDAPLLAGSRPFRVETHAGPRGALARRIARGGLRDLRFYDSRGREVPYLLVDPPLPEPEWRRAALVLPVPATKKESGLEADLGAAATVDRVRVEGLPRPLLKRLALDGSGDRQHWTRLVAEATLFDLPDSDLRQLELAFPPGAYRYLRITWNDSSSARVPLPGAVAARIVRADAPARPRASVPVAFDRRASEPGTSRFRLRLAAPSLPVVALRLTVGGAHLLRRARVTEARLAGGGAVPVRLGEATLKRTVRDTLSAEELRVAIEPPTTSQLELEVDDGDNPPLEISGVEAELAELPWIYIEVDEPLSVVARWGDAHLDAPRYDLESARRRAEQHAPPAAAWGPALAAAPAVAPEAPAPLPETGPPIDTAGFRYARDLPDGPAGLVSVPLDAAVLAHSSGRFRSDFADLRVVDEAGRQLPYLLERRPEPLVVALPAPVAVLDAAARSGPGTSVYRLKLPYAGLPPSRLVLRTSARVFERHVDVLVERPDPRDRRRGRATRTVATADWRHAEPEVPAPALCLSLPALAAEAEVLLAVREGDNAPLALDRPELLLPSFQVRFFRPGTGALRVLYGHERLPAPRYDLTLLAPTVLASPASEIALAPEQEWAKARPAILPPRAFWAILLAAAVVLLLLIARLVVRAEPSGDA